MSDTHWATLTVALQAGVIERDVLARAADQMQDLAALLAMESGVSGVETRDPMTSRAPIERPELVVYTAPEHLEALSIRARALTSSLELDVVVTSQVREDEDWKDTWKAHYRPLVFGDRQLLLRPSWIERRPNDPPVEVVLDPGRAFGTGLHESTALCLHRLCSLRRTQPAIERALDLGCGSGILMLATLRLWHDTIVHARAVDIDPEAVATAIENADFNNLGEQMLTTVGTLDDVSDEPFDLLLANIRPEVLIPIAATLRRYARPGADLILSGILSEEAAGVAEAFTDAGFSRAGPARPRGEWVGLDFTAP